ncbi:MAG: secondary thiamine-phosphate synthase enzyme [Verrucomicrobiales bacterium]|jgi:secondary thiamine-phosphate synthase enzyme
MVHTEHFQQRTNGKHTYEITDHVARIVHDSRILAGTVTIFTQHTSCSLVIMENADPSARTDLHAYFEQAVPEDSPYFIHTYEGADDMPSHIRTVLTGPSEIVPIEDGRMTLGTWQGIFLFEHRRAAHTRKIVVTVMGEK